MRSVERVGGRFAAIAGLALSIVLSGCDALDLLLDVETPSRIIANDLDDPARAGLLVESARNEFRCAFGHYVNVSAVIGGEWTPMDGGLGFLATRTFTPRGFGAGAYVTADCDGQTAHYMTLSRARWFADDVLEKLEKWGQTLVPEKVAHEAELAAWSGYSHLFFGESMCTVAFDGGPELPATRALELAVARFDKAITAAQAASRNDILNVARVGKGRALLNLGRVAEAATAVTGVPDAFNYFMQYSGLNEHTVNLQYRDNVRDRDYGVGDQYKDMRFAGVADPRVPVRNTGTDLAGFGFTWWHQLKYRSIADPVRLASGAEAMLIRAEAALAAGRLQEAVAVINALHTRAGLPAFSSNDATQIKNQIIYERRAELFLESHRWADLKRYKLPYQPAAGQRFFVGALVYTDATCLPLPDVERYNNDNIEGSSGD
jgi:hypothetical protein